MKTSALLTTLRNKASRLDKHALVGWFSKQGKSSEYIPLSDLNVVTLYRGYKARKYKIIDKKDKTSELRENRPCYLIYCPAVFHEGRVHIGGDNWYQRSRGPRTFWYRTSVPGSRPMGEFRDVFSSHPRNEVTLVTSLTHHDKALLDRQLCRWGCQMLDDEVEEQTGFNPFGDEELMPPSFLIPRKRDCLELREGECLRALVSSAVKRDEWHIDGLVGLTAPDRGTAVCSSEKHAKVVSFSHDNGCKDVFIGREVEEALEDSIFRVFGVRQRVDLRFALPEGQAAPMRSGQSFFTPVPSELTFEKLEQYWGWEDRRDIAQRFGGSFKEEPPVNQSVVQSLKYMAALTSSRDINGVTAVDIDVATGRAEPFVHMGALMCRIQKLVNMEDYLIYESSGLTVDIPHVCARMELQRRSQEFRERVAEIRNAPGVEIEKPEEKVLHASSGN